MRPPAAIFLGLGEVQLHIACAQKFRVAFLQNISVRCGDKACTPKREVPLGARAVCSDDERPVGNRMSTHDGHPTVLLTRVDFLRFAIHPANGSGVDEHVGSLQAHDACGFGEPLVPANKYAERTRASLDGLETCITWNKVIFLVKGRIIGNVALAVKPGDASVTFKDESRIVVDSACALFEEREHDNGVQFFCNGLPLGNYRMVFFDSKVKKIRIFLEREIRSVEQLRQDK